MILVTGANGNLGSLTIDALLEKNPDAEITGLVRSEEKGADLKEKGVEVRIGDYTDYSSLEDAVKGVDTLLLVSTSTMANRHQQHKNVIEAAKEAGVKQIFYTSIVHADQLLSPLSEDHYETEKSLKESGVDYTIYRNTFYMEFLPTFMGKALDTGDWIFPSDGNKINLALRTEMAEALANGLLKPEQHKNKTYEITSGNAYGLSEIAQMLNDAGASPHINYADIEVDEFKKQLEAAGLPDDAVMMSASVGTTFANGGLEFTYEDLEQLLGRKPTDLKTYSKEFMKGQM